ncbi:Xanthine dehydrogenase [Nostocoides australiense Ben110]|uniref:Xanthine dehydrogenase n=1 Tax=Nostocoides australiense Ben110 TaxID=1193182 RepID=W6K0D0_9MICO|nr:xanthine dehydrogenase family protein molybdopterin-binding subunit [Tetrasphaera australiensis]CCH74506.1 Xanthine dehydrogenase [Tetrasphaera australiensis Ben110]
MSVTIGGTMDRTDGVAKVTGKAQYGVDHVEAGMAHAAVVRSPVPAGRLVGVDVGAARRMPEVVGVVTAADQPDSYGGWVLQDQRILASDQVRYEGEPIAIVVAETRAAAIAAAAAVRVEIEEWEAVTMAKAVAGEGHVIHPDWQSYVPTFGVDHPRWGNCACEVRAEPDGVDEAFARAAHVVEDTFTANRQYQAYLEPKAATASYADGRYILHTATQYPFNVRERVAQLMGVRLSDVRVVGKTIGGGFGAKLDGWVEPLAALAARVTGRTVQVRLSRAEDILTCPMRENATMTIRTALDDEGRMIGRQFTCEMDNGAYSGEMPWLASLPLTVIGAVYKLHGPMRAVCRLWYTNTPPTGAFRGVNGVYLYMAQEQHMDHIADTLGVDRREYRLRHLFEDGDASRTGQVLEQAGILRQAFDRLEERAPWQEILDNLGPNQGVGIAAAVWMTNPLPGEVTIKMSEDGTASLVTAANDNGSGAVSMGLTQIVASTLGLSEGDVRASMPDTDISGYDGGSQGSRTTAIVGTAALEASTKVREQLLATAAGLLEAHVDDIELVDGQARVKGSPSATVPLGQVAAAATFTGGAVTATSSYATPPVPFDAGCATGALFTTMCTPTYHVHLAVVEVDDVTGNVDVVRYVVVQDAGKVISPVGARGQVQGGIAQGIGYSLYESQRIGDDARLVERSLESYRLPLAVDIPDVEVVFLENPDPQTGLGAKGIGEAPIVLSAAAISTAVRHATGRTFNAIPITPEDVMFALQEAEEVR